MIPDGWNTQKLEEVSIGILDCHHSTPEWTDSGYIVLRTNNIRNGVLDFSSVSFTNELNYHERVKRAIPEEGDIVVTREAPAGEVALIPSNLKVCLGQRLVLVKLKHNLVSASYIKFYLMSDLVQRNVFQLQANGSTVGNIRIPVLKSINLLLPPLLEQCRIAEVLGVWDESIDLLERLIGKVRSRKQWLMQQLLTGKKRFKEFEGSEWKEYQLSQIANITMGTSPKSESYNSNKDGLPLLQGNADIKNRVSLPKVWTSEVTKECYPNDILISVRAPVGTVAISLHHACIGRGIASIKAKSKILPNYLYQLLLLSEPKWASLSQGSTFDSVNSADIRSRVFSMPLMISEQEKIAAVLSAADEEISTLEKQLAAYKQQKLGLMQQLLTGSIRI
jgi:type I restriction enzyme, S subunit